MSAPPIQATTARLTPSTFRRIRALLHERSGIHLADGKDGLVRARLNRRLAALGLTDFAAYLDRVESEPGGAELDVMVDLLTTNKTSFLREPAHFELLRERILPALRARGGAVRIWSAGCSSGEEPYTLAMLALEEWGAAAEGAVRILATDLSARMLAAAREGVYTAAAVEELPGGWRRRYLEKAGGGAWRVAQPVRALTRFARLNLMDAWPMRGPFDVVFCRNVMIYFDQPTQERLVQRYWEVLAPEGHLFVGHSESLTRLGHRFRYAQPAVYVK